MINKELLDLAAKAAGIVGIDGVYPIARDSSGECYFWNPLKDDALALRLAVKLRINVFYGPVYVVAEPVESPSLAIHVNCDDFGDDPYAATRYAIVRAAAVIGRNYE